jgi:thiamine biosynthesis lipoprotein
MEMVMQLSLPLWRPTPAPARPMRRLLDRPPANAGWLSRDEAIMGTAVRVELWAERHADGQAAIEAVMAEMRRIDRGYSPHKPDSELSRLNRHAATQAVAVGAEMFGLLQQAHRFSTLSGGAFDITHASVGHLYDYRRQLRPSDDALARGRSLVGWRQVQLDPATRSVRFERAGVRIDLGGFAKGHAVNQGAAILQRLGVRHAMVSAGGDSRVIGDRRGRPWSVAIRHPRQPDAVVAVLPLEDVAISTSGDYERFFEHGGERFHHLLDPVTGRSPSHVHSVTIVAADGLTSEALSKTVFVLGVERGLAIVHSVPGADAVVIDKDGTLHYSNGLQRH